MPRPARRSEPTRQSPVLGDMALEALRALVGGFPGDEAALDGDLARLQRDLILLVTRLVFRLHAEASGFQCGDSSSALCDRLDADAKEDGPALEQGQTAWPQLLALARGFGDDGFAAEAAGPGDGAVWRALRALRAMDDPRAWYRSLDLEALGGVYEALMDYRLRRTRGPGLVLRPGPVVIDLQEILSHGPDERARRFAAAGGVLDAALQQALVAARSPADIVAWLGERRGARAMSVLPSGSLVLQPGEERRRAGAHYTPRGLADPIVRTTLRPLLAALGERPTPAQLLDLRLCDPATGCGAFLLAACRQLGEWLAQAWREHGVVIPPAVDGVALARREVARRCLHGVDKDPCAVELTRLSLWLLTGAEGSPRTFMAEVVRCGDALVGLAPAQIAAFSWAPCAPGSGDCVHSPEDARARSNSPDSRNSWHSSERERARSTAADSRDWLDSPERERRIGDAAIAVFFAHDGDRRRDEQRGRLARATVEPARRGDPEALAALDRLAAGLAASALPVLPFHWQLEFPAVFARDDPGFDCFVGNPPFFWGNRISRAFGDRYRDWLLRCYPGSHGNSDLAAYFLRRSFALLRRGGTLGFVTTNSIAEADTRATGLEPLLRAGGVVYEAVRSAEWDGSASVRVAHVFVAKGGAPDERRLDGEVVAAIGADLRRPRAAWTAVRLRERAEESYKGVDFGGTGFLLTAEQRDEIVRAAPHEGECIWPVMNASNFTSSPQLRPEGFIINFTGLTLAEAERYGRCMAIVRERVLPRRAVDKRKARRERWWLYNEACSGLYRAIAGKTAVIVCPVVAKYVTFARVDARAVFTNALNVFTFADHASLAVLQSRVHELWALTHSSSLRADPRYNPSDCFETFPLPEQWQRYDALAQAGQRYDECRRRCMLQYGLGLTGLYNRFHDPDDRAPDVGELRQLHAALDRAALAAHGWTDLAARVEAMFRSRAAVERGGRPTIRLEWPAALADEVLGRLLALNQRRAAAEREAVIPRRGS
ncbi:Eco57I restriction-modification methylase domain-containing protein [Nannocystis punicea]|uniref:site-specific DNA-methyltransferase (adenine-specific) n=1 Tax=Nannocystis punicea TaxID=2995304 RepID=A0ABY7GUC5_9BACT|nr:type IIL restriction-modification enzyme MmeI [Nannocystis poenicansa]WAS90569.1 hypothetical protein O0S08_30650 [Nannocystis poenicansa]